jgi:threonine/homoserine/homoserine lactone efflux protein
MVTGLDPLFIAYLVFTSILVLTPGATTVVVVQNTLRAGRDSGLLAAAGAALGNASHAALAALGLTFVLQRWPSGMMAIQVGGGLYLASLGAASLRRSIAAASRVSHLNANAVQAGETHSSGPLRQGLTVNLLNPAIATFYLAAVPSFIPPQAPRWYFTLLAAIHIGTAFLCHVAWATAMGKFKWLFRASSAQRLFEAVAGMALIALALKIIWR